jgi:hypothetical protein
MTPVSKRLSKFFFHYKEYKNDTVVAKELGYRQPEKISRLFREGSTANPSVEILVDIANRFGDELNMDWVISGKGSMLKTVSVKIEFALF